MRVARMFLCMAFALLLMGNTFKDRAWALMEEGRIDEAFAVIEEGVASGDAESLDYLGWFYDNGRAVPQDKTRAASLYRQAAILGVAHAQWRLGVMIDTGEANGTLEEAVQLFRQAAEQGFTNGFASLGVMQASGRGTALDYKAARASFEEAARRGNVHAFNEIGVMYMNGEGVDVDPQEGAAWIALAAALGSTVAQDSLATNFSDLDIDPDILERRMNEIAKEFDLGPEEPKDQV